MATTHVSEAVSSGNNNPTPRHNTDISPNIQSGFTRVRAEILACLSILAGVFIVLYFHYLDSKSIMGLIPADEYCATQSADRICSRSDLFAFQVSSGLAIFFCGMLGFYAWHISKSAQKTLPSTSEGRLFGYLKDSERLAAVNFSFQIWDFFISLLIPEHRGALMLIHHFLAAIISWCSLEFQVLHYYGVYFLGVTEFSSIFLVFVDLAKFFPPQTGSLFDTFVGGFCAPLFALTFAIYRIYLWWDVSYLLWSDCYKVFNNGMAEKLRPGKSMVLYVFLASNLPLGLLQLYWFSIILGEARKVLGGEG